MLFDHIIVSGLTTLVIDRCQRWVKSFPNSDFETWTRIDFDEVCINECISHEAMVKHIHSMNKNENIQMWIHKDTINVTILGPYMTEEIKEQNALITSTFLGIEDHGIFIFWLNLDYGGSGQGAGGLALDNVPNDRTGDRIGTSEGLDLIMNILKTVGVSKWEDLPGKYIRVRGTQMGIEAIAHPLKDNWFIFKTGFK